MKMAARWLSLAALLAGTAVVAERGSRAGEPGYPEEIWIRAGTGLSGFLDPRFGPDGAVVSGLTVRVLDEDFGIAVYATAAREEGLCPLLRRLGLLRTAAALDVGVTYLEEPDRSGRGEGVWRRWRGRRTE